MNYVELKKEIQEIIAIAQSVPDEFRNKCFEVLLGRWIDSSGNRSDVENARPSACKPNAGGRDNDGDNIPNSPALKAFMRKTSTTRSQIARVLVYDKGDVHFISEPTTEILAEEAAQWALLLALQNVISGQNDFEVDPEGLRSICQEKSCYDKSNFWRNFAGQKYSAWFKGSLESQGSAKKLSDKGKIELGRLIVTLAGE